MRLLLTMLATTLLGLPSPGAGANPYLPAYTVNGRVITDYDIEQRVLFLEALGAPGNLRETAEEQLVEDRLKVQAAEQFGVELPEDGIEIGIAEFAEVRGLTVDDVLQVLEARDIDRQTMDDFVEAGLLWREVVGTRFRAQATPTEEDLDAAMELAMTTPVQILQLAEIALPYAERGEEATLELANELYGELVRGADFAAVARTYSRSATAAQGGLLEPLPANQLPDAFRAQILLLSPGQISRPIPITGGIAILRLVSVDTAPPPSPETELEEQELREQLRRQIFAERITAFGQGFLQEMLTDALIVEK